MTILIEINYIGWESDITQRGNFKVDARKFKADPERAAAEVAHKWINDIRRQRNVDEIILVKYNDIDITEKVKELDHF